MKTFNKVLAATALVATTSVPMVEPVQAHQSRYRHHHYRGQTVYAYRACRHSSGSTGLIAGGVGGAVIGSKVIGGGILGTAAGAVGGALAGRAIDRTMTAPRRCRVYR